MEGQFDDAVDDATLTVRCEENNKEKTVSS